MNCLSPDSKPDWKTYALGEMEPEDRRLAEAHAATCESCHHELATLRLTLDALSTLREEEVPRRIAFVSDKVFEPRWWQRIFNPTFAAASVLAAAILVHAFVRPSSDAQVQARVDAAVTKAVAQLQDQQVQAEVAYSLVRDAREDVSRMYIAATGLKRQ